MNKDIKIKNFYCSEHGYIKPNLNPSCSKCTPQVDKNQSKEFKYDTLEIQKLVGEQINRNYSWNLPQSKKCNHNTYDKNCIVCMNDLHEVNMNISKINKYKYENLVAQVRKETISEMKEKIEKAIKDTQDIKDLTNRLFVIITRLLSKE